MIFVSQVERKSFQRRAQVSSLTFFSLILTLIFLVLDPETTENNSDKSRMLKLLSHGFDEVPTKVPMATFEQDLEDDFQFLPGECIFFSDFSS